jgi:hypothetical protein
MIIVTQVTWSPHYDMIYQQRGKQGAKGTHGQGIMHGTGGTGGSRVTGPERTGIMGFRETRPELLTDNPFKLIGADWMLITAGTKESLKIPVANGSGSSILKEEGYSNRSLTPQKAAENSLAPGFKLPDAYCMGLRSSG